MPLSVGVTALAGSAAGMTATVAVPSAALSFAFRSARTVGGKGGKFAAIGTLGATSTSLRWQSIFGALAEHFNVLAALFAAVFVDRHSWFRVLTFVSGSVDFSVSYSEINSGSTTTSEFTDKVIKQLAWDF
jgi:hypothetical protein